MKKIVSFNDFLYEDAMVKQASLLSLLSDFTRMYIPATKHAPLEELQFLLTHEDREWESPSESAKIGKPVTQDGTYTAQFNLDNVKYEMTIDFSMSFESQPERDVPDTTMLSTIDKHDLGIKLNSIDIKHIKVDSTAVSVDTSKLADSTKEAAVKLLIGVMKGDFDVLGPKINSITH